MTKTLLALALVVGLFAFAAVPAQAQVAGIPVTATGASGTTFNGTLNLVNFATNSAGQIVANGVLSGTVSRGGTALGTVLQTVQFVVGTQVLPGGACSILHLELGPIDLNLLGLRVQTNRIVVDITAIPGGGLLGDLLSSLLCSSNPLNLTSALLNQILAALRGI